MKKFTVVFVLSFLVLGVASAQNSTPFRVDAGKFSEEYAGEKSGISSKVMNNFNKMFSDASNVMWSRDKHNIDRVYFERIGKVTRAAFNKKGQFLYSITTYTEEFLPQAVLLLVKQSYYGKSIFGVTEVSVLEKTAYLIILEDRTSWLHIKVLDAEISVERVLLKAN